MFLALGAALAAGARAYAADPGKIVVHADKPGHKMPASLYGLMTEEINHSYDGGLYAELIQNRTFRDDAKNAVHWSVIASTEGKAGIALDNADPVSPALPTSLRLDITSNPQGQTVGVANDGFWGIPLQPNMTYTASFYAKASADFDGKVAAVIVDESAFDRLGGPRPSV